MSDFYPRMVDAAVKDMHVSGVLASITIAQAMLESNFGRSELAVNARNYFGIKSHGGWKGPTYSKKTWEVVNGRNVTVTASFRSYESLEECVTDHGAFLQRPHYKAFLAACRTKDYRLACHELVRAGYATDPKYAHKLIRLIDGYQLAKWDHR